MRSVVFFAVVASVLTTACASSQPAGKSAATDRNVISLEEIQESSSITAYEMVQRLRPHWLSPRGIASLRTTNPIMLYVNENRVGTIDRLKEYAPRDLSEIRYLDAIQATQRFGTNHRSGAIMLYLRRGSLR